MYIQTLYEPLGAKAIKASYLNKTGAIARCRKEKFKLLMKFLCQV